ncbi:PEP-CTERM sorting domain-containing protein [Pacificimonas sp. WHA3]|uniref:PEP-CTERM sorting domain-containing protein n=1 Tax=Pacificimonas pallii TaxID=2827236 RepID=A0ABS6SHU0_9SPHN|nr:PEP-CTERM sorting domain-containing protein [Pacificimonas pallii]MBV7257476.1 PEP-CTERM sorting domain-containing protein [Pacificimonas pallii]
MARVTNLTKSAAIGAMVLCAASAAPAISAITFDNVDITQGFGSVSASGGGSSTGTVDIGWNGTPFGGYADFTADASFDVVFNMLTSNGSASDVSGFILEVLDSPSGNVVQRLTNDTNACANAAGELAGTCDFIAAAGANSGNAAGADKPVTTLFSDLIAGSYRLGVFDSATPSNASAQFLVVEQVPAPGTIGLLGLGLLMAAAARRAR